MELEIFLAACESFTGRAYWERVWIIQELMMAKSKRILCGKYDVPFTTMSNIALLPEDGIIGSLSFIFRCVLLSSAFGILERLLRTRNDRWRCIDGWIEHLSQFKCTDAHDRVYGILTVFTWNGDTGLLVTPDYGKSVFHLAEDVIQSWKPRAATQIHYLLRNLAIDINENHLKDHVIRRRCIDTLSSRSVRAVGYRTAGYALEMTITQLREDGRGRLTCCFESPGVLQGLELMSPIDQTIAASQRETISSQYVYIGDKIVAAVNGNARSGDFFAELGSLLGCCLILRPSNDQTFEIIGQACKIGTPVMSVDWQQCGCAEMGNARHIHWCQFNTTLSVEDVIVLIAQDMTGPKEWQFDSAARLQRLNTRVSMQAHPMAQIVYR